MSMFNIKTFIVPALIVAAVSLNACSGDNKEKNTLQSNPVTVTLASVSGAVSDAVLASGQVEAAQTANISTRVMGTITHIYVKVGDKVSKGQLLATISDEDIKAKRAQANAMIAEAEAAFATAQKDYDRFTNLYKQQSATARELDNVTFQYNSAKSRLDAARQMRNEVNAMLAYSSLIAPFSGVVTQKLAEEGNIANPGMPILSIEQSGILQVSASVAESDISNVKIGDEAEIQLKSTGKLIHGKITQLNPSSQFSGGQYIIKVSIPEADKKDVFAGMYVSVTIPLKQQNTSALTDKILVPLSAIVQRDDLTGVYTVSANNTALLRWIRVGKTYGDKIEVVSGLSKDEKFILCAEGKLYNGVPVTIKK